MSREQRRVNRRPDSRGADAGGGSSRRTPVRAPGGSGSPPWAIIAVFGGTLAVVLLVAYLLYQSSQEQAETQSAADRAEQDDSSDIPGTFVPSQGRGHFSFSFSQDRTPTPFCDGVRWSGNTGDASSPTPAITSTPDAASTPVPTAERGTEASDSITPTTNTDCYASNPASSGEHLGVARNVDIGGGVLVNIPADPNVYPDDIALPRESIPHILEHAGVFVGWNCAEGDQQCSDVVGELKDLVNDRIDNFDDRVVLARDPDLPVGEIGLASWTRVLNFAAADYDEDAVRDFIATNACRFDPEGFCG